MAGQGIAIDATSPDLAQRLTTLKVDTLIHAAGPFQGQDYTVVRAAIVARANYIDLADSRKFVVGIDQLDKAAQARGVLVTSGASSLPALSSAVVDRYLYRFSRLDSIAHGISAAGRAPGIATMKGVFGYCGKGFQRWERGAWRRTYCWLDMRRCRLPAPVGTRWLGSCDVPDLTVFLKRYAGVQTVTFHAGFGFAPGHLLVWLASYLVRLGLIDSIKRLASPLYAIGRVLEPMLTDKSAMVVAMTGVGTDGQPLALTWYLVASQNHGGYIPCGAVIALALKLATGGSLPAGAQPCMGLLSVEEYLAPLRDYEIREVAVKP